MVDVKMYTLREAAPVLRVHTETLLKMIRRGELPAVKIGRKWLVRSDDLERVLREGTAPKGRASHSRANYDDVREPSGDPVELAGDRVLDPSQLKLLAPASSPARWEARGGEVRSVRVIG